MKMCVALFSLEPENAWLLVRKGDALSAFGDTGGATSRHTLALETPGTQNPLAPTRRETRWLNTSAVCRTSTSGRHRSLTVADVKLVISDPVKSTRTSAHAPIDSE